MMTNLIESRMAYGILNISQFFVIRECVNVLNLFTRHIFGTLTCLRLMRNKFLILNEAIAACCNQPHIKIHPYLAWEHSGDSAWYGINTTGGLYPNQSSQAFH